ncbi:hypothetical protein BWR19_04555 [Halomonas sp. 1513]|nr:hypothetical protein BWR19_04555 [Halomonas sp. 1513]
MILILPIWILRVWSGIDYMTTVIAKCYLKWNKWGNVMDAMRSLYLARLLIENRKIVVTNKLELLNGIMVLPFFSAISLDVARLLNYRDHEVFIECRASDYQMTLCLS